MLLINTFDVEPWWTSTPACVEPADWSGMPDRSEAPLREYLDLCDEAGVKGTFFFIGWYAANYPQRVREVLERGHEVGCHSLFHEDVATQTDAEFEATTQEAKDRIEQVTGSAIQAYRAPAFSFPPERVSRLLRIVHGLGFTIDSSITTAGRIHGGGHSSSAFPRPMSLKDKFGLDLFEVPVPGVAIGGHEVTVFGGGYLRMMPRQLLNRYAGQESYQVLYLHPHDFDLNLPRLPRGGPIAQLRRRLHVGDIRHKVLDLFKNATVKNCEELARENAHA